MVQLGVRWLSLRTSVVLYEAAATKAEGPGWLQITGIKMAGTTGLEPATSDVTGRRSNQLSYVPARASLSALLEYHSSCGYDFNN